MKTLKSLVSLSLTLILLLCCTACSLPTNGGNSIDANQNLPSNFLKSDFDFTYSGSIFQTGDGKVHIAGSINANAPRIGKLSAVTQSSSSQNTELVTFEHNIKDCYVGSYLGKGLFGVQNYGDLDKNKFGIATRDGNIILPMEDDGFFSLSAMYEDRIIVGNPTSQTSDMLFDHNGYRFGYLIYDEESKTVSPMYENDNLRFYTAGYFINGYAVVSVLDGNTLKFGVIDINGNYIVEPTYDDISDESYNGAAIAAATTQSPPSSLNNSPLNITNTVGRMLVPDGMNHSMVQGKRMFAYVSDSVGIIDIQTGKEILKCEYKYVERIFDDTYYVVDRNGEKYFFDLSDETLSPAEYASAYFNSEWYIIKTDDGDFFFVDRNGEKYSTKSLVISDKIRLSSHSPYSSITIGGAVGSYGPDGLISNPRTSDQSTVSPENSSPKDPADETQRFIQSEYFEANENNVMTNILSAVRDDTARKLRCASDSDNTNGLISLKNGTLVNNSTGEKIEGISSHTEVYRGSMLLVIENELYYLDINSFVLTRIETGFGGFGESISYYTGESLGIFSTELHTLSPGVISVTYVLNCPDNTRTYHKIIVNDKGTVLLDSNVNSASVFNKNYLGKYDTPLYELAGNTNIEDNYLMVSETGKDYLLQLVRGESELNPEGGSDGADKTCVRTIREFSEMMYMSPFRFNFENTDSITVKCNGQILDGSMYIFDSAKQTLLFKSGALYNIEDFTPNSEAASLEIEVIAGDEITTVYINYAPFDSSRSYN